MNPVEKILCDAKIAKKLVDEIILVEGSTCIFKKYSTISNFFNGKELC